MNKKIELVFNKSLSSLAGYPFGERIYKEQVKDKINLDEEVVIKFPDEIVLLASSFVQGFFSELIEKIGVEEITKKVKIEALNDNIKEKIFNNLL